VETLRASARRSAPLPPPFESVGFSSRARFGRPPSATPAPGWSASGC